MGKCTYGYFPSHRQHGEWSLDYEKNIPSTLAPRTVKVLSLMWSLPGSGPSTKRWTMFYHSTQRLIGLPRGVVKKVKESPKSGKIRTRVICTIWKCRHNADVMEMSWFQEQSCHLIVIPMMDDNLIWLHQTPWSLYQIQKISRESIFPNYSSWWNIRSKITIWNSHMVFELQVQSIF